MQFMRKIRDEEGQALVLVALAMSIFLIGAIGLGIDGSHLYAHRQMAQTAADAAALSAIEDIYEGTYSAGGTGFSIAAFTCSTSDTRTPCAYAANNGFGTNANDTVAISFPGSVPGVSGLAAGFPAELVTAKVSRTVPTTLLRFLGPTSTTVSATAT
ncbi:MAG TPA: pilus assembly protein TadG-related protein, partial [Acidobacteriaceae bacterium]